MALLEEKQQLESANEDSDFTFNFTSKVSRTYTLWKNVVQFCEE